MQRSADLVLRVPDAKVESTSDGVIRTVDRFGGIVAILVELERRPHGGEATFDLRIPTDRLDDALAALSKLGHVAQRSQNLVDITGSFTSVQDRLSDARAERRGLLGRSGARRRRRTSTACGRACAPCAARSRASTATSTSLRRRADLSTVSVTVRGDGRSPRAARTTAARGRPATPPATRSACSRSSPASR